MSWPRGGAHSGWNVDTLREHVAVLLAEVDLRYQQRFDAQQRALDAALLSAKEAVQAALLAAKEAVRKAEDSTEKRLVLLNELRAGVATKEQMDALAERQAELKERLDRIEGHSGGMNAGWQILVGAVAVVATVVTLFLALAPN